MNQHRWAHGALRAGLGLLLLCGAGPTTAAQEALPTLTEPVNDFAQVIDPASRQRLDDLIRRVQSATGDAIVVATRPSIAPFADERELAVTWFENNGRGIGDKEKDSGVLFVLAPEDRAVWIEVGYGLEGAITDSFAGRTSRDVMVPLFREGRYGEGLVAGVTTVAERIARERGVSLGDLPPAPRAAAQPGGVRIPFWVILLLFLLFLWLSSRGGGGGGPSQRYRRGRRGSAWGPAWSGWGPGMTTGGFGGGAFGGGSFGGGGFGGFGGGMSGGGGGGARW